MAVKIRLARHGKKGFAFYHIVAADSRAPRDGKFIEKLGTYNPNTNPATIDLDFEKALGWLQKGAQPTDTCRAILSYKGVLYKKHLLGGVAKGAFSETEAEARFNKWLGEKAGKIEAKSNKLATDAKSAEKARLAAEAKIKEERAAAIAEKKAAAEAAAREAAEAAAASKAPAAEKKEAADANAPLDFEKIAASIPAIEVVDMGVSYKQRDPESPKFVTIGERIHCISPVIREAMNTMNPEPILKRAAEQIKAGATYLDVNIGPAESNGPELMTWAVKLLQENFNNVPLALDTANKRAIEAGIKVYNRTNGKPIVNSADAGSRISYIDLAAANDAICIALCSADGIAKDNEERMMHCHHMLERGLSLGMEATDLWFDPLFLVVKGMQDKQMDVLNAIKLFSDEGLKSTGGLSNNSNGAPKNVRPIMDSALVAMAMMQGLTSAIVNPNDLRLMETIKSCDIFKNNELYSDSYLDA